MFAFIVFFEVFLDFEFIPIIVSRLKLLPVLSSRDPDGPLLFYLSYEVSTRPIPGIGVVALKFGLSTNIEFKPSLSS